VDAVLHHVAAGEREPAVVLAQARIGMRAPRLDVLHIGGIGRGGGNAERGAEGEGEGEGSLHGDWTSAGRAGSNSSRARKRGRKRGQITFPSGPSCKRQSGLEK